MNKFTGPALTVDAIIKFPDDRIALIKRKNEPFQGMWALPGGFVDVGEHVYAACEREVREECNIDVKLDGILGVYSDPSRDPRGHTVSVVYLARPVGGELKAADGLEVGRLSHELVRRVERAVIQANIDKRPVCRCPHEDKQWARTFLGYHARFTGLLYVLSKSEQRDHDFSLAHLPPSLGSDKESLRTSRQRFVQSRYATAFNRRGIVRAKAGRLGDAIADFKTALDYDRDYEAARNNLSALLGK